MAVQIFELNDCEWWAGECSPGELLAAYMLETGLSHEAATGDVSTLPRVLSDEELDRLMFRFDDETGPLDPPRSFREELATLVAECAEFPCHFATDC